MWRPRTGILGLHCMSDTAVYGNLGRPLTWGRCNITCMCHCYSTLTVLSLLDLKIKIFVRLRSDSTRSMLFDLTIFQYIIVVTILCKWCVLKGDDMIYD